MLRDAAPVKQARSEGENVPERSWTGKEVIRTAQRRGRLLLEIEASGAKKRDQLVLDGKSPTKDGFFGDPFEDTTGDDGLMRYRITLLLEGKEPIVIDRVCSAGRRDGAQAGGVRPGLTSRDSRARVTRRASWPGSTRGWRCSSRSATHR